MNQTLSLNTHLFESGSNKVDKFQRQKCFYSQEWPVSIIESVDKYKSPYFQHQSFKIFFTLVCGNGCYEILGSMNLCNTFNALNVYFRIDFPDGRSISKKDYWVFKVNQKVNSCKFEPDKISSNSKSTEINSNESKYNEQNGSEKSDIIKEVNIINHNDQIESNNSEKSDITKSSNIVNDSEKSDTSKSSNMVNDACKPLNIIIYFEICQSVPKLPSEPKVRQEESKPKQELGRIGLDNIITNCYVNSSVQILFHIPKFRQILYDCDVTTKSDNKKILLSAQFLFYMMQHLDRSYSAIDLFNASKSYMNDSSRQKDATEFIYTILEKLKEEMNGTDQVQQLNEMFQIVIESKKECKPINFYNCCEETSDFINIPVNSDKPIKLYNCIKEYLRKCSFDYFQDGKKYKCYEWREIKKLPPVLSIYLNRVNYNNTNEKLTTPVIFTESMYFDDFSNIIDDKYRLYAVLYHYGLANSGHYYALIREFPSKEWYKYNDNKVSKIKSKKIIDKNNLNKINQDAYALFYIRKKEQNNLFKLNQICPIMKEFMENYKSYKEKQEHLKENIYSLNFTLEEDINELNLITNKSIISPKILQIYKYETCLSFYNKVADLFNKNVNEIRLWKTDSYNINKNLIEISDNYNIVSLKNTLIFIQNKKQDENVIPNNDENDYDDNDNDVSYIMIFIKYFDLRLKKILRYIGPLVVDENKALEFAHIFKILDFPEWTKFFFFHEIGPMVVKKLDPSSTFKSAGLKQGSSLIVQVNRNPDEIEKSDWTSDEIRASMPDLSLSKIFEGVELRHQRKSKNCNEQTNKEHQTDKANKTKDDSLNNIDLSKQKNSENNTEQTNKDIKTDQISSEKTSTKTNADSLINKDCIVSDLSKQKNIENNIEQTNKDIKTDQVSSEKTSTKTNADSLNKKPDSVKIPHKQVGIPRSFSNPIENAATDQEQNNHLPDQTRSENAIHSTISSDLIPCHKAIDYIPNFDKARYDNFIGYRYNMYRFFVYDYDCRNKPAFILDFPSSLKMSDMCMIIRKIMEFTDEGLVLLFSKFYTDDSPSRHPISDSRFTTQLEKREFPGKRIYFLYDKKLTSVMNIKIFDLQIASDGYNVSFTKTVAANKNASTFDLLKKVKDIKGFPIDQFRDCLDRVEKRIQAFNKIKLNTKTDIKTDTNSDTKTDIKTATNSDIKTATNSDIKTATNSDTKTDVKTETNSDTKTGIKTATNSDIKTDNKSANNLSTFDSVEENDTDFLCFKIVSCKISKVLNIKDTVEDSINPIRVVPFIPPEIDEVPVFVCHVKIGIMNCMQYIKDPFYMNVRKTISVIEFKEKVLSKVKIDDKEEFMRTKIVDMATYEESKGEIKNIDMLVDLKPKSTIFIIY